MKRFLFLAALGVFLSAHIAYAGEVTDSPTDNLASTESPASTSDSEVSPQPVEVSGDCDPSQNTPQSDSSASDTDWALIMVCAFGILISVLSLRNAQTVRQAIEANRKDAESRSDLLLKELESKVNEWRERVEHQAAELGGLIAALDKPSTSGWQCASKAMIELKATIGELQDKLLDKSNVLRNEHNASIERLGSEFSRQVGRLENTEDHTELCERLKAVGVLQQELKNELGLLREEQKKAYSRILEATAQSIEDADVVAYEDAVRCFVNINERGYDLRKHNRRIVPLLRLLSAPADAVTPPSSNIDTDGIAEDEKAAIAQLRAMIVQFRANNLKAINRYLRSSGITYSDCVRCPIDEPFDQELDVNLLGDEMRPGQLVKNVYKLGFHFKGSTSYPYRVKSMIQ